MSKAATEALAAGPLTSYSEDEQMFRAMSIDREVDDPEAPAMIEANCGSFKDLRPGHDTPRIRPPAAREGDRGAIMSR